MPTSPNVISSQYAENLAALGATPQHIHALNNPKQMPFGEKHSAPYTYLARNEDAPDLGTVFYVPGFTETPVSDAPFGVTLANHGFDVVLPGNYTGKVLRGPDGRKDALHTRAQSYNAIIKAFVIDEKVKVVSHSMGSLVAQNMIQQATAEGHGAFRGTNVVMLAPSGISDSDSLVKLGMRNGANLKIEKKREPQEFNDDTHEAAESCAKTMTTNPLRSLREMRELVRKSGFDARIFAEGGIANVALVGYAADPLYTDAHIIDAFHALNEAGVPTTYATPLDLRKDRRSATHNDEQANPSRVAPLAIHSLML